MTDTLYPYENNDIVVDNILDGISTPECLGLQLTDTDIELRALIESLYYATKPTGKNINQMDSIITLTE